MVSIGGVVEVVYAVCIVDYFNVDVNLKRELAASANCLSQANLFIWPCLIHVLTVSVDFNNGQRAAHLRNRRNGGAVSFLAKDATRTDA